jgi:hypothetical protein
MAEFSRNGYTKLFEIRLLHHYWLDDGSTVFDAIAGDKKEQRLASYDVRDFLTISPTSCTVKAIKGLRYIYKETALGCIMLVPKDSIIPDDTIFEFAVTVRDPAFFNYTALTLRPQKIYELFYQPEQKGYRYKENVPLLSNKTGTLQGSTLFLSKEIPDSGSDALAESLYKSGNALMQLTGDQPGAGNQQLNADAANMPVYCHQGDVPAIVPPAGLSGAPERGILLKDDIPDSVFLLIHLETMRVEGGDFSLVDINGHPKATSPVFHVRFKNRSTFWRYLDMKTGAVVSTEAAPLPLTNYGNAGTKQKPSEGLVKVEKSGDKITRLVSEIYM